MLAFLLTFLWYVYVVYIISSATRSTMLIFHTAPFPPPRPSLVGSVVSPLSTPLSAITD